MIALLAVITFTGVMVVGNLDTETYAMNLGASPTACSVNSTMTELFSNVYSGFNLALIIPTIVIACALLGIVLVYCAKNTL